MRRERAAVWFLLAGALATAGCGEQRKDRAAPPPVVEVEGIDPDDQPDELSEKGRRPGETFCDGPNSTASSC